MPSATNPSTAIVTVFVVAKITKKDWTKLSKTPANLRMNGCWNMQKVEV
jgi:hypothetical protein